VVLVSLDTPRGPRNEGGDVAAPVFARVAEHALRHLAIPPDDADRVLRMTPYRPSNVTPAAYVPGSSTGGESRVEGGDPQLMPDLRGQSAREAALVAARRGLLVELKGSGRVVSQTPDPGTEIDNGARCVLTLDRPS
jgi:cell division protein FtsI (penicillin-binding protein 3)